MPSLSLPRPSAACPVASDGHDGPPRSGVSYRTGFWFTALSFTVLMAFGTAPTPLWPLYAERDGFGTTTTTVVFAALVVGAGLGFLALGHLSDRFGRRRIVVPALSVVTVAALVYVFWPTLPGLLAGRLLNGAGIGLMASTATTYLHDLHHRAHPDRPGAAFPGIVATTANLGGLALGPLLAGAAAEWTDAPLALVQGGFAVATALCLVLALTVPETVGRERRSVDRPRRFALRVAGRRAFLTACVLGFCAFALFGLVASLGAVMLHVKLGVASPLVVGLAGFLMSAGAATGQLALGRLTPARAATSGCVLFPAGLALVAFSLYHPVLWLYLAAIAAAGAGAGLLFKAGVATAGPAAAPDSRAGVLAAYFAVCYAGMGVPSVGFSLLSERFGMGPTMIGFAAALSTAAAFAALALRSRAGSGAATSATVPRPGRGGRPLRTVEEPGVRAAITRK
ncbi:MFS transporter [Streptomyces sp. NPDC088725]|uniref:MFS transporter n=1 Tax=Streptomyces sp. NPDC088725 TaxID=3365873 RepID=UPI003815CB42